jgi:hypothetical protein
MKSAAAAVEVDRTTELVACAATRPVGTMGCGEGADVSRYFIDESFARVLGVLSLSLKWSATLEGNP